MNEELKQLVKLLPEVYQPIFRSPELSISTSRECQDRLNRIESVVQCFKNTVGRPLKILDLGCAQGFFSLNLASLGNKVHGVDFLNANINVCQKLASIYPELEITFEEDKIENIVENIEPDQFDLVLGLSVFHHLAHHHGSDYTQKLLSTLASKVAVGIFECALSEEPLYWAPALPKNPRDLIKGFSFITQIAKFKTHLSDIKRPLYFASNRYFLGDQSLTNFLSSTSQSHMLENGAYNSRKRYFFAEDKICKQVFFDHPSTKEQIISEYENETNFLSSPPQNFAAPSLLLSYINDEEATIVRSLLPGKLLLDLINSGAEYNSSVILNDVLDQLATLEKSGLYHTDLRIWNVIVTESGNAKIIDFGSIARRPTDCTWPKNIHLSFVLFAQDLYLKTMPNVSIPARDIPINPDRYPNQLRELISALYQHPFNEWSFALLHKLINAPQSSQTPNSSQMSLILMMISEIKSLDSAHLTLLHNNKEEMQSKIDELEKKYHQIQGQLNSVLSSNSWRATRPLRYILDKIKKILR